MVDINVVEFPKSGTASVVDGLRALADKLEAEGAVMHNLAWVLDNGDGNVEIGLLGKSPQPAMTAYFMYGIGMRKLEDSI